MNSRPRRSLRTKLLVPFIAVGVVPSLLLAAFFTGFSINYVRRVYAERAVQQVVPVSADLEALFLRYRSLAYELAQEPMVVDLLTASREPDRDTLLEVYQLLYRSLSGDVDRASIHVASRTRTPSLSTHQFPTVYQPMDGRDGISWSANQHPERTVFYSQSYGNEKGEIVNFSLVKTIRDQDDHIVGYVIIDLFKSFLAETFSRRNNRFFTDAVITDNTSLRVVDLFRPENDGTFSNLPYLGSIDRLRRDAVVIDDTVIGWTPILDGALTVICSSPTELSLAGIGQLVAIAGWIVLGAAGVAAAVAIWITRDISRPIHALATAMERVEGGDLSSLVETRRADEIGILFRGFNRMVTETRELLAKTVEEHEALRIAEIKSLQAQINPHFLYNTLGTIKSIAKLRSVPEVVTIATELGRLLRGSIDSNERSATLADSIAVIRSFTAIQDLRHPGKYHVSIDIEDDALNCRIPRLILQPIVENAFVHGLEQQVGPGSLSITGTVRDEELVLTVADDGVGFKPAELDDNGGHVGLANVDRRLRLLYGEKYAVEIESTPGHGCTVILRMPARTEAPMPSGGSTA